ncbi:hypothetical protein JY651_01675 [Pyxidicoccus parkwayensis]|uniref:DUF4149 domain-containing protein n=1 Tax=Pyxidicoccus parkwayensis TaxID=2813578 RepID=A0ABX7NZ58_9BACT|nr:hypothetical protein [Pyxidicoccus parkwaysis]QSQ23721.1 hypothetical protein JY651_01675 [Pyxidicoccus parkwaysis]
MSGVLRWAVWGFASTLVLTGLLTGSQRLRLTRLNLPFLLGTLVTPDRDRAKAYGLGLHLLGGMLFSGLYVAAFTAWGRASWWLGGLVGVLHAGFVLLVVLPVLPAVHPRMASESQDPTEVRQLEPPGVLGLHYGVRTPLAALVAHVVFGVLLGALYRL